MEDRLLKLLDTEQLSSSKFADVIGVQRSSVSHILTGRNKPSFDFLQKTLKAFPMLNADWLILGEGEMYEGGQGPGGGSLFDQPAVRPASSAPVQQERSEDQPFYSPSSTLAGGNISGSAGGDAETAPAGEVRQQESGQDPSGSQSAGSLPESQRDQVLAGNHAQRQPDNQERFDPANSDQRHAESQDQPLAVGSDQFQTGSQDHSRGSRPDQRLQGSQQIRQEMQPPVPGGEQRKVSKVILFYTDNSFDAFEPA